MADIELVIKMPEEIYKNIQGEKFWLDSGLTLSNAYDFIKNGTVLPKGHGDLIDRSKIYKAIPAEEDNVTGQGMTYEEMDAYNGGINAMYSVIQGVTTIIEADKESENG